MFYLSIVINIMSHFIIKYLNLKGKPKSKGFPLHRLIIISWEIHVFY